MNAFQIAEERISGLITCDGERTNRLEKEKPGLNHQTYLDKKAKLIQKVDPTQIIQKKDIWMHVISFVGPGHFVHVAGVNRPMKEWHKASFDAIEDPPTVRDVYEYDEGIEGKRPATSFDTTFRAVFSSIACANYWNEDTKGDSNGRVQQEDEVGIVTAKYGNLEVFKWAKKQFHVIQWAQQCGLDMETDDVRDGREFSEAAFHGNLEFVKYLHENDCTWNFMACDMAASGGHLGVLKYLHENGCEWDEGGICDYTAIGGNLGCLKYVQENGCRFSIETCTSAAKGGHLDLWPVNAFL